MLLQVIDFLSLFSLFISGVMMVPRGPDHNRPDGGSEVEQWEFIAIVHACAVLSVQRVLFFLLAVAQVDLKWYFNLLPFQTYLYYLLLWTMVTTLNPLNCRTLQLTSRPSGSFLACRWRRESTCPHEGLTAVREVLCGVCSANQGQYYFEISLNRSRSRRNSYGQHRGSCGGGQLSASFNPKYKKPKI